MRRNRQPPSIACAGPDTLRQPTHVERMPRVPHVEMNEGPAPASRYWRRTRQLTLVLLVLWLVLCLLATFFARAIDFTFFGWRFSFWFGAQGMLLAFLAIVVVYVLAMQRLEREAAAAASEAPPSTPEPMPPSSA